MRKEGFRQISKYLNISVGKFVDYTAVRWHNFSIGAKNNKKKIRPELSKLGKTWIPSYLLKT